MIEREKNFVAVVGEKKIAVSEAVMKNFVRFTGAKSVVKFRPLEQTTSNDPESSE